MKILYIDHSQKNGPGWFLEECIRKAFEQFGVKIDIVNFCENVFYLKHLLEKGSKNTSWHKQLSLAQDLASALLPLEIYRSDADFVFFIDGSRINRTVLRILKDLGHRLVTWQFDDPYWIDESSELSSICDFIFSVDSSALDIYRAKGCKNRTFLPLGFPEELGGAKAQKKITSDICFYATPFINSYRVKLVDEVASFLKNYKVRIMGSGVERETWKNSLKHYGMLKNSIREGYISPEKGIKYQRSAKINLNVHRDNFGHEMDRNTKKLMARSPNVRTFTLAGAGAFQLVDDGRPDLAKLFKIGKEIVTFSDADDLKEKITYYLKHDGEREAIAKAAQKRALAEHTIEHRVKKILKTIAK